MSLQQEPPPSRPRRRTRRSSIRLPQFVYSPKTDIPRPLAPDTEDNVKAETEGIFLSFMHERYQQDMTDLETIEDTPRVPELSNFLQEPTSDCARIGRQLAMIGDDINNRYRDQFEGMVRMLDIEERTAYSSFAQVAKRLLKGGMMNWGRVITLLCFGYRIAITVLKRGIHGFISQIINFMVKFIVSEKIAKWIADQGGWIAALQYIPESWNKKTVACIGLAAVTVLGVCVWISKR